MPHHFAEWRDRRLKEVQAPSVARELTTVSAVFNHALPHSRPLLIRASICSSHYSEAACEKLR